MLNFYNSMKSLVTPDMVKKAAHTVDEKTENTQRAINIIIPGLLAMYLKKHSPTVNNILSKAGNLDVLKERHLLCEEKARTDQSMIADDFLQAVLGDQAANFSDPIAQAAGVSKVAVNRLVYMIAPMVAGSLGEKLVYNGWAPSELINEIASMKPQMLADLPSNLVGSMSLSHLLHSEGNTKKKGISWGVWVIVILAVLIIAGVIIWQMNK